MTTFNDVLRAHGINPDEVSLLRHQTRTDAGSSPFDLWTRDRAAFELYQSTQEQRPVFRRPRYWAAFVAPAKMETLFVGLYEVERVEDGVIDWLDPLTGQTVGAGKNKAYDLYKYRRVDALSDQIGKLRIDWANQDRPWAQPSVRSWAQHARHSSKRVLTQLDMPRVARRSRPAARHAELTAMLERLGFDEFRRTQKVTQHVRGTLIICLKRETLRLPIVLHPWYEAAFTALAAIEGVSFETPLRYYVNSNLTCFPVYRDANRLTSSHYGLACEVSDETALMALIAALDANRIVDTPDGAVEIGGDERDTDRIELRLGRIGQGAFRCGLNRFWQGRCAVTGLELPELLRASHIVPWKEANNRERLDPFNGLLLGAHLDALFDKHLISFDSQGRLLLSQRIDPELLRHMGLDAMTARLSRLNPHHLPYLARHRDQMR
jgi:HNH endonuclease